MIILLKIGGGNIMPEKMFQEIAEQCPKKKIISLCKKLEKKLSFKSGKDVENLCHLTYWLYIYGFQEQCMQCISLTEEVPFNKDYAVWTFIHSMWGLKFAY